MQNSPQGGGRQPDPPRWQRAHKDAGPALRGRNRLRYVSAADRVQVPPQLSADRYRTAPSKPGTTSYICQAGRQQANDQGHTPEESSGEA